MSISENNKRIAKNTIFLYIRTFFTMLVSLYTSRIVLKVLGVDDFGIYGIVGGIVILFSFLNTSMAGATQRFLSFEIGKNNFGQLNKTFNASIIIHLLIAVFVLVLAETVGFWVLNTQLNLPDERMNAANWVYQFSVITFLISIIQVPYNAAIIAYEKMSFYAYLGVVEAIMKLGIVFLLSYILFDKLILYGILLCLVAVLIFIAYFVYCKIKFQSTQYVFVRDKKLYRELLSFSGWSIFGSVANLGKTQGTNILINIFCGVAVNAAVSITNQVINALNSFVSNFQTAFKPQIISTFAANENEQLYNLIFRTAKYSYYLLFVLSLPVFFNTQYILQLWLGTVPEYTTEFCQLTLIYMLLEAISGPLWMVQQATGKIKNYQIIISSVLLLNIPVAYFLLKFSFAPYSVMVGCIVLGIIAFGIRILFLRKQIELSARKFFRQVVIKIIMVSAISVVLSYFMTHWIENYTFISLIFSVISIILVALCTIYLFGIDKKERVFANEYLKKRFIKNDI